MSRVSVIIPAYNSAEFLGTAIESVMRQSYRDYEIIVVDDGSVDDTSAVADAYAGKIEFLSQANSGVSSARNHGLSVATGEYVAFLDADDLFLPNKLEHQVQFLDSHCECDVVHSAWCFLTKERRIISTTLEERTPDEALRRILLANDILTHTALSRRDCFERYGGFDESITHSEDWDLWLRFALQGARIAATGERIAVYRIHGGNRHTANRSDETRLNAIEKFFRNNDLPDEIRALEAQVMADNALLLSGPNYRAGCLDRGADFLRQAAEQLGKSILDPQRLSILVLPVEMYGIETRELETLSTSDLNARADSVVATLRATLGLTQLESRTLKGCILAECARIAYDCRALGPALQYENAAFRTLRGENLPEWLAMTSKCVLRAIMTGASDRDKPIPPEQDNALRFVRECEDASKHCLDGALER